MTTAILDFRPAAAPGISSPSRGTAALVRLFALDRPRDAHLLCRWQRDAEGRLVAQWEPDIGPGPKL